MCRPYPGCTVQAGKLLLLLSSLIMVKGKMKACHGRAGVIDVELLMDREQSLNRGFCFVEFYNHSTADLARKILSRPDFRCGKDVLACLSLRNQIEFFFGYRIP